MTKNVETDNSKNHDPLKWFGILVPGTLRQSQGCFDKSIEMALEVANIQQEIQGVLNREKYLRRIQQKSERS